MRTKHILTLVFILLALALEAQQTVNFKLDESHLSVKGTSSLHDWEMVATDIFCTTVATLDKNNIQKIDEVSFKCKSTSLKSEHKLMDSKAHDALKAKKHPEIIFSLNESEIKQINDVDFKGSLKGTLYISGVSKSIMIPVKGKIDGKNELVAKGTIKIKMSNFSVEPPTAMFGTITTGNDILVEYDFKFSPSQAMALINSK